MGAIIVRDGEAAKHKVMKLFALEAIPALTRAITAAIEESFQTYAKMNNPTGAEVRDRFNKIMKNVLELRGDRKWGVQRINDAIPDILRAELGGEKYQPSDNRTSWVASDGE